MEKILLAMDAAQLNMKTIDFACYIARLTRSRLTGVFLEGLVNNDRRAHISPPADAIVTDIWDSDGKNPGIVAETIPSALTEDNIRLFREACICRETLPLIHRDRGIPLSEITTETRFADLLIVDSETSFEKSDRNIPARFVKDVLEFAECPVLIAPPSFDAIEELIFTYDGSSSSVFAVKQFTAIFPGLRNKKLRLVSVRSDNNPAIEEQFKMKEWLRAHYDDSEFVVLKGQTSDQLLGYLVEKKNAVVVMGAYGRTMLSRFFKPSQARLIVKTINLPIFIAHQ